MFVAVPNNIRIVRINRHNSFLQCLIGLQLHQTNIFLISPVPRWTNQGLYMPCNYDKYQYFHKNRMIVIGRRGTGEHYQEPPPPACGCRWQWLQTRSHLLSFSSVLQYLGGFHHLPLFSPGLYPFPLDKRLTVLYQWWQPNLPRISNYHTCVSILFQRQTVIYCLNIVTRNGRFQDKLVFARLGFVGTDQLRFGSADGEYPRAPLGTVPAFVAILECQRRFLGCCIQFESVPFSQIGATLHFPDIALMGLLEQTEFVNKFTACFKGDAVPFQ